MRCRILAIAIAFILSGVLTIGFSLASAQPPPPGPLSPTADPGIRDRIQDQQERINQGIRSGQLTPAEAKKLQDRLNKIRDSEARLKADGRLTPAERDKLQKMLDKTDRAIYKEKHDPQRRPPR
jgi:septal ring factor EnvC (AmiA/AmiB activator)